MKTIAIRLLVIFLLLIGAFGLLFPTQALAFCPVCTAAAAAAVGLSRWIGVDDTISGLWIGGLIVSSIGWTINYLRKRKISIWWLNILIAIFYYLLIIVPFYKTNIISFHPKNLLWGTDKLLLGMVIGSIFFLLGHLIYQKVKKINGGHAHFPFENIAFPIVPLLIWSAVFYFLTR